MATRVIKAGDTIYQEGEKIHEIAILIKGNVEASSGHSRSQITAGNILGIPEIFAGEYIFTIKALEDVTLYSYKYTAPEDLLLMLRMKPELGAVVTHSMFRAINMNIANYERLLKNSQTLYKYIKDSYEAYRTICAGVGANVRALPALDNLEPFQLKEKLDSWVIEYYTALKAMPTERKKEFFNNNIEICYGMVMEASRNLLTIHELNRNMAEYVSATEDIILNEDEMDLFSLLTNVAVRCYTSGRDYAKVEELINSLTGYLKESFFSDKELIEDRNKAFRERIDNIDLVGDDKEDSEEGDSNKLRAELVDSLDTILTYSMLSEEAQNTFRELVNSYKALPDKNSTDTEVRAIRKQITNQFFDIYEAVALRSFEDFGYSPVIKMFLYFGYMDEELAGYNNADYLFKLVEKRHSDPEEHTFALIEWLSKIYVGEKEPSKNEFDMDYTAYIREERRCGRIDEKEEKAFLNDNSRKVQYEIRNMAKSANLMTYGRLSSYCPIFSKHNIIGKLETMYVNAPRVAEAIESIKNIDYTAYYREILYKDDANKITKELIEIEVIPDVILMPNIGVRGGMWQEYAGADRKTPARFLMSIFCAEDVKDIICRLTGEFRWELCKRIQGLRWNDITEKSLTSEYADYVQFYRKNSELSSEAKERLRLNLIKCKNNLREYFVREYVVWVKAESQGSARLNKVSRGIMNRYIPFSPNIRQELRKNPMYGDLIERFDVNKKKKIHNLDIRFSKIEKDGGKITPELKAYRDFLSL